MGIILMFALTLILNCAKHQLWVDPKSLYHLWAMNCTLRRVLYLCNTSAGSNSKK